MKPHDISAENAAKVLEWFQTCGGIAIWSTEDASESWTSPLNAAKGKYKGKQAIRTRRDSRIHPDRIITSADEVLVHTDREVARFHVAVCMGSQGLKVKLTDATPAKVKKALEKAGPHAYHAFDYERQDALIMAPDGQTVTLTQWAKEHQ